MARKKLKSKGKKVVPITAKARSKGPQPKGKRGTAAAPAAGRRRLRFRLPVGSGGGMEQVRLGMSRTWRELLIRLRLSRAAKAQPDQGKEVSLPGAKEPRGKQATGKGTLAPAVRRAVAGSRPSLSGGHRQAPKDRHQLLQTLIRKVATVEGLAAVLLAVLLFYPPYFRGLFFARELLPTHIYTAMLFALLAFYKIYRREPLFSRHPLDWAMVVLLALYATSGVAAWNARDALGALLKMANYVAIYWMLAYSVRSLGAVRNYLAVLFTSSTGVAVLGLGAAFGTFRYKDAFVGGRIYSSLQYPNTLAAFLTAVNLFGLYLWAEARQLASKLLFAVGNYLLFLTFLGTQSRGALLIYPLGLLVLLAGLYGGVTEAEPQEAEEGRRLAKAVSGDRRWSGAALGGSARVLGLFVLQLISALAVFGKVMAAADAGGHARALGWLWVLAGAAVVALLQLLWHYAEHGLSLSSREEGRAVRRTLKPWVLPALGVVLILAVAAGGYAQARRAAVPAAAGPEAAWKAWVQRIESISLQDQNAQDRLIWSRDAFRIMTSGAVNALLGAGGGGWNALYHRYQDYLYYTTEVHNHFMQVGVETGIPGLLAFIAVWVFFLLAAVRLWRAGGERSQPALRGTAWAIFSGALALGLHSLIDFNLSLGAVAILLWGLFGLERGLERISAYEDLDASGKVVRHPGKRFSPGLQGAIAGVLAGTFFLLSLTLALGDNYAQAATAALKGGDAAAAVKDLDRAIRYDPWTTAYRMQLAQILLYQGTQQQDGAAIRSAQEILRTAVQKSRGDFDLRILYARALFNGGQVEEGVKQLEEAVRIIPLKQEVYDSLAVGYLEAGRFLLEQSAQDSQAAGGGNAADLRGRGRSYLEKALQVPGRIEARMAAVPKEHLRLWRRAPLLAVSPTVRLKAGEAAVLLARWPEAESQLKAASGDPKLKPEALLWQGLALKGQGKDGEALIAEALKLNPDLAKERERIEKILPVPPAEKAEPAANSSAAKQDSAVKNGGKGIQSPQPAAQATPQPKQPEPRQSAKAPAESGQGNAAPGSGGETPAQHPADSTPASQ